MAIDDIPPETETREVRCGLDDEILKIPEYAFSEEGDIKREYWGQEVFGIYISSYGGPYCNKMHHTMFCED